MLCPKCRFDLPDGSTRCTNCLALIDVTTALAQDDAIVQRSEPPDAFPQAMYGSTPSALPPANRIPVAAPPYRMSGKVPTNALVTLIALTLVSATVFGSLYYGLAKHDFAWAFGKLGFLACCLMGLAIGGLFLNAGKRAKVRNSPVLIGFMILSALLTFGVRLAISGMQPEFREELALKKMAVLLESGHSIAEVAAVRVTKVDPATAAMDYVKWLADGHLTRESSYGGHSRSLKGFGFWFEFLFPPLGLLLGGIIVKTIDTMQFCEKCEEWRRETILTQNSLANETALTDLVKRGEWNEAKELPVVGTRDASNNAKVAIVRCDRCGESFVQVRRTVKNRTKTVYYGRVEPELGAELIGSK